ncbi:S1/P1 nuclease [Aurantiacibacter poecillastricola]|uniref:S1/P1 nuclease n=1 Tax=Aurantiacibacter poecillastricola TaxID=3064385 RepID=UPI00273DCEBA|nr:S1/P1 nuclease [Aurantiacibacter sp. 219JJ12-13]MDP5263046.1 S1/P1 nuclease [Aurantiacibacter sp. 219JJ12-13]
MLLSCALAAAIVTAPAKAWGPIGHRVSADIAEDNLGGKARARIAQILGHEGLAEASTWPDEQRSNPEPFWQETASPFHYVTLPPGQGADGIAHPPEGDALTALEEFTATLRDDSATQEEQALALRFVVHIVSDLHQPLHAGNGSDRGGNDFVVSWFENPTNLHWVWDEGLIQRQQLSYSEYSERLERRIAPEQVLSWWEGDPAVWIAESAALRDRIYPQTGGEEGDGTAESPALLSYDYHWEWIPTVENRLAQSGIRLAAYLDWVFAED